jgi:hypothetical protein
VGGRFAVAKQPSVPRRAQSHTPSNARHPSNACGSVVGRPILYPFPEPDESIVLEALADTTAVVAQKTSIQKEKDAEKNPCGDHANDCKQAIKNLRDDAIATIALDIRVGGRPGSDYPCECRLEGETFQSRRFATTMMTWKAAGNCHKPLYFEDWNWSGMVIRTGLLIRFSRQRTSS